MKIAFAAVGREKRRYTIENDHWVRRAGLTVAAPPPRAELTLRRLDEERIAVSGEFSCAVEVVCDRCGDPVVCSLDENFFYLATTKVDEERELEEREFGDEESNTLYLEDAAIDVMEILCEQVLLAMPAKVLCDDDCRGVCQECGGSLNREECTCAEKLPDSPFAVLKKLRNTD